MRLMTTQYTAAITDPATLALSHLARAAEHDDDAGRARLVWSRATTPAERAEALNLAHSFEAMSRRECKRAEVLAQISQAEHLGTIADALARIALAQ